MSNKVDLALIKQRLNSIKTSTTKQSSLWKPQPGKNQIRLVPYKFNPSFPFIELYFHFDLGKRSVLSPTSFGEKDPIVEFSEKLKRSGDKDDWRLGKKLEPKLRVFAPIIVRGEEKDGVKFWGFGKTVYQQLLGFYDDPDYGDLSDVETGRDLVVEFQTAEDAGRDYPVTNILVKPNQSPLVKDAELRGTLLENQKNILEVYTKPSYDELKEVLAKFLNPEAEDGDVSGVTPEPATEEDEETPTTPVVKSKTPKVTDDTADVEKQFNDLFERGSKARK